MLIRLENVGKTYREGSIAFEALSNVDLVIKEGESVAIMGASGSGKSTLLNILVRWTRRVKENIICREKR